MMAAYSFRSWQLDVHSNDTDCLVLKVSKMEPFNAFTAFTAKGLCGQSHAVPEHNEAIMDISTPNWNMYVQQIMEHFVGP